MLDTPEAAISRRGFLGGIAATVTAAFIPVMSGKADAAEVSEPKHRKLPDGWEHVGSGRYRFTAFTSTETVVWAETPAIAAA
jgi:hypothetical protein